MFSMILMANLIGGAPLEVQAPIFTPVVSLHRSAFHEFAHSQVRLGITMEEVKQLHGGKEFRGMFAFNLIESHHRLDFGHRQVWYTFETKSLEEGPRLVPCRIKVIRRRR